MELKFNKVQETIIIKAVEIHNKYNSSNNNPEWTIMCAVMDWIRKQDRIYGFENLGVKPFEDGGLNYLCRYNEEEDEDGNSKV